MPFPPVFLIHTCDISRTIDQNVKQIAHGAVTGTFSVGQTITGSGSLATGRIYAVGVGYLQYTPLTGTFASGETIASETGSAKSSGLPADAINSFGVPIVIPATQTNVACRFFGSASPKIKPASGEHFEILPKVLFLPTVVVVEGDRITGKNTGFLRTYTAKVPKAVYEPVTPVISHYSVDLEAVT